MFWEMISNNLFAIIMVWLLVNTWAGVLFITCLNEVISLGQIPLLLLMAIVSPLPVHYIKGGMRYRKEKQEAARMRSRAKVAPVSTTATRRKENH